MTCLFLLLPFTITNNLYKYKGIKKKQINQDEKKYEINKLRSMVNSLKKYILVKRKGI